MNQRLVHLLAGVDHLTRNTKAADAETGGEDVEWPRAATREGALLESENVCVLERESQREREIYLSIYI